MAKAERLINEKPDIRLTLSYKEASVLRTILHKIGGDPQCSARFHTDSIVNALTEAKVEIDDTVPKAAGSLWM